LPSAWTPDDRPLNVYRVDVPGDVPDGDYSIGLLVYDADSLEPLGIFDAAGNAMGVEVTIGTVRVAAHQRAP
jgi:hypothetical protein